MTALVAFALRSPKRDEERRRRGRDPTSSPYRGGVQGARAETVEESASSLARAAHDGRRGAARRARARARRSRPRHQAGGRRSTRRDPAAPALHVQLPAPVARLARLRRDRSAASRSIGAILLDRLAIRATPPSRGARRSARSRSSGRSGASTSTWSRRRRTGASTRSSRPTTRTARAPKSSSSPTR